MTSTAQHSLTKTHLPPFHLSLCSWPPLPPSSVDHGLQKESISLLLSPLGVAWLLDAVGPTLT